MVWRSRTQPDKQSVFIKGNYMKCLIQCVEFNLWNVICFFKVATPFKAGSLTFPSLKLPPMVSEHNLPRAIVLRHQKPNFTPLPTVPWWCVMAKRLRARNSSSGVFVQQSVGSRVFTPVFLKTLDTIGNCQKPVFSLAVSQYLTNLWKF